MKKLIIIIILIATVVGVGYYVLEKKEVSFSIENILPQQALVYVQIHDVEENFQKLAAIPFWQGFSNVNFDALLEKNVINNQQFTFIKLISNQFSALSKSSLSKRLFGQQVAFAVYTPVMDFNTLAREMKTLSPKFFEQYFHLPLLKVFHYPF